MTTEQFDVFFYEAFEEEAAELKNFLPDNVKAGFTWKTIQEYDTAEPPAKLISVRTQSTLPLAWKDCLAGILTRSTGYDHILKYRENTGVEVLAGYLPLYCNRSVAEQALTLWMALLRKLPVQMHNFQSFHRDGITGYECENKTLVVVGIGNIGSEIVKIGQGLGMKVYGVDLVRKYDFVNYIDLEDALPKADILVCSMNLTKKNINYFNYDRMKKTKPGVVFVNIARGELSHSGDMLKLVEEGQIGALGMDVYNQESDLGIMLRSGKTESDNSEVKAVLELAKKPNVIFTPHNSFNTHEAVDRKSGQSIEQVVHFLKHSTFKWPVPAE